MNIFGEYKSNNWDMIKNNNIRASTLAELVKLAGEELTNII